MQVLYKIGVQTLANLYIYILLLLFTIYYTGVALGSFLSERKCCFLLSFIYLFIYRITLLYSLLFASQCILRVEVLGLSNLNFGSIIYFCEAEHPLGLLAEAPGHN